MERRALITGIAGQDGSLLSEHLLDEGYEVYGIVRGNPSQLYPNLREMRPRIQILPADLLDQSSLIAVLQDCRPHEVYNLASPSFVPLSWEQPVLTAEFAAVGVTSMLEAIRHVDETIRFYQASSSEIFGEPSEAPQTEDTPITPATPYGVAKAYGHFITQAYRRQYGIYACSGILYNHESPRRPVDFLPRKVANGAARIAAGLEEELVLGDLDARRDWGYAGDYVKAMWLMLQRDRRDAQRERPGRSGVRARAPRLARLCAERSDPRPRPGGAPQPGGRAGEGRDAARLATFCELRGARPTAGRRRSRAARTHGALSSGSSARFRVNGLRRPVDRGETIRALDRRARERNARRLAAHRGSNDSALR
jgi:GDPmannose 4,6-dehydratase